MSKIFDALRKAEQEKSGSRRVRKTAAGAQRSREEIAQLMVGVSEAFRRSLILLRNAIDSEMKNSATRVIMFASALEGEGKTTIVSYLARLIAAAETERVLLVDCAVAGPQIHYLFGLQNDVGILDHLAGTAPLEKVIKVVEEGVLDVVTCGNSMDAGISQPLFNSQRMEAFVRTVAEKYDYVLIDTSAVLEAPETPIIGAHAGGTVIVVQAGRTKREVIKRAMMMIQKLDGRFIGTVLNRKKYYIPEFIYRRV